MLRVRAVPMLTVTLTTVVLVAEPVYANVIWQLYAPTVPEVDSTLTTTFPVATPLVRSNPIRPWQFCETVAVKAGEPPVFVRVSVCVAGAGPFCDAVNVSELGVIVTFTLEVMTNVTGMVKLPLGRVAEVITTLPVYTPGFSPAGWKNTFAVPGVVPPPPVRSQPLPVVGVPATLNCRGLPSVLVTEIERLMPALAPCCTVSYPKPNGMLMASRG